MENLIIFPTFGLKPMGTLHGSLNENCNVSKMAEMYPVLKASEVFFDPTFSTGIFMHQAGMLQ